MKTSCHYNAECPLRLKSISFTPKRRNRMPRMAQRANAERRARRTKHLCPSSTMAPACGKARLRYSKLVGSTSIETRTSRSIARSRK